MTCETRKLCCALIALSLFLGASTAARAAADREFAAIPGSAKPTNDAMTGNFSSPRMAVEVVLRPSNESELSGLLTDVYNPKSEKYQHWLGQGEFVSRFAPGKAQVKQITDFLRESGLEVEQSSSPFLLRVSGSSSAVEGAFKTSIQNYRNRKGIAYYSNASEVQLPTELVSGVLGVVGLSNTARAQSKAIRPAKQTAPAIPACEAPYPAIDQLYDAVNFGTTFSVGYGGSPGCNGLTQSQDNAIY
jgi:subtilase family serine protease